MTNPLRAPLLWLLLPFMAGIAAGRELPCPSEWMPWLAAGAAILAAGGLVLGIRYRAAAPWAVIPAVALCGYLALLRVSRPPPEWTSTPREVTVVVAVDQVYAGAAHRKTWSGLGRISAAAEPAGDLVGQRVYFTVLRRTGPEPERTGAYRMRGVLQAPQVPQGPRSFQSYLETLGIRLRLERARWLGEEQAPTRTQRFFDAAGRRLEAILRTGIETHPDLTSVYLGMLLGEKAALSPEQQNAFMRSGTFHLFSVSGLHVAVIAGAIQSLLALARVPRRAAVAAGLVVLWLYVEVTGGSSPAVRSFLMVAFLLGGRAVRLPGNALASLTAAALCTLLFYPVQLFDLGFQMSYGVVTALVVMGIPLGERVTAAWRPWRDLPPADWRWWQRWTRIGGRWILSSVTVAWVALLASTPSGIGYFGLFSPGSLLANLVVIPLSTGAIVSGFTSILAGLAGWGAAAAYFNHGAALVILVMDWLVLHGTELPGVYFPAAFRAAWLAPLAQLLVLAVMLAGAAWRWPARLGAAWWPAGTVALVLIFCVKFG